jgi:DNA-binding NarL/FixJ family response regulator
MEKQRLNLFIVANNALVGNGLRHYLQSRFGGSVRITNFYNSRTCLKKMDKSTQLVVLDYFLSGKSGLETLKCIKAINPDAEVIMHSSSEAVAACIEAFHKGLEYPLRKRFREMLAMQCN